ncbi:MAG: YggT family protein [Acidimicrobiaceae bacterium]|nr:YggT family protein [Acidimicrobiaceae bacterium]MXZ98254.1 YggT family protein [Acidimicrobiaceae bacterium]MYE76359.1 YggT family protein [Acidimicrobiaceae bacterium]MYE96386.1 YggT family protein [Acidimicrobiaceae bacterium]MYI53631.1 YggT family protein [Acidimicrobiaceae bacterium]
MLGIPCLLLQLYALAIFGRVLLSWFPLNPGGAMATMAGFLYTVTDPVMKPVRRMLPAARFGGMALDFSPVIVIFGIFLLQRMLGTFGIC